jgi:hypothetical protein
MPVDDLEKCSDFMERELTVLPTPLTDPKWRKLAEDSVEAVRRHLIRVHEGDKLEQKFTTVITDHAVHCALAKWMQTIYAQGKRDGGEELSKKVHNFIMSTLF